MIIDHATADGDGDEFDDDGDLGMITVTPISNVVIMRIRDYDDDEGDGYDDDDGLDMVLLQALPVSPVPSVPRFRLPSVAMLNTDAKYEVDSARAAASVLYETFEKALRIRAASFNGVQRSGRSLRSTWLQLRGNHLKASQAGQQLPAVAFEARPVFAGLGGQLSGLAASGESLLLSTTSWEQPSFCHWTRAARPGEPLAPLSRSPLVLSAVVSGPTWLLAFDGHPPKVLALPYIRPSEALRQIPLPPTFGCPRCATTLPDFTAVAACSRGTVAWWDTSTWQLMGSCTSRFGSAVIHLSRVWIRAGPGEDPTLAKVALVAAMDDLGHCRVIDCAKKEVLCTFRSQQSSLGTWIDEPVRIIYDVWSGWISAATTSKVWTWDVATGAFARSAAETSNFGAALDVSLPMAPSSPWRFGEVMMDGPLWTLPVLVGSPVAWSRSKLLDIS
ncbi:hypothetical protein AK812_SmicGene11050 [Symbiodinium microadriaticum]|uniref:Uncharacterized protein n=1 Tax=Symbiodinium microadriaticum TaxID=2951 RepID=A0A1Q9EE90_SYMMI|nr:hypothetical protein AK812_SmicGene11050 [Symbiodinium microadriaticum]